VSVEQIPETLSRTQIQTRPESWADVLVVGAGPTGMACAIEAHKAGFKPLIIDKGCVVNSIYHYPNNMVFFTTPELLEIGDVPFTTSLVKPTRLEALEYYRRVAEHFQLHIRQYEWVKTIAGEDGDFRVTTTDRHNAIHDYRARKIVHGGGANAIYNLADLGVNVLPVGVVGDDEPGKLLLRAFRHKHIPVSGVLKDKSYTTVTKTRILAGFAHTAGQQVVRLDREPAEGPNSHLRRELVLAAREYARASDALLVSDYGYGAATPTLLNVIREKRGIDKVPVTLDSRHRMLEFTGVTAATPNESEVEEVLSIRIGDDWERLLAAGDQIAGAMNLESLLITRGKDGMVVFPRRHKPVDIPIYGSDEVADVTGAGDTVIATFTAALAADASAEEAAHLANYAGGIVVMKRGTATVSQQELLEALEKTPPVAREH